MGFKAWHTFLVGVTLLSMTFPETTSVSMPPMAEVVKFELPPVRGSNVKAADCMAGEGCPRNDPACAGDDPNEQDDKGILCPTDQYMYTSYQMEGDNANKSPIWVQKSSRECVKCGGFDQVNCLGLCNGMAFEYFRCTPCYCSCSD